jgi:glycosyltransferase involved in cell wall biosynthesis
MGFAQLRTQVFFDALRQAGHTVGLLSLEADTAAQALTEPDPNSLGSVVAERAGWLDQLRALRDRFEPELVVSAGPYNAGRAAAAVAGDLPFWMDIPGDPFAEAQAKVAYGDDPTAGEAHARASIPGLLRADAFSVISRPQRYALLGALGWSGRLASLPPEQRAVFVVPISYAFGGIAEGEPRSRAAGSPLVLALVGGFNTWFDSDTLWRGLDRAFRCNEALTLLCTGGAVQGHHLSDFERFKARVEQAPWKDRVRLHGWVPHDQLPKRLSPAHVLICLDRLGVEAELGGRTRVLFGLHQGLEVIANAGCEQVRALADQGFVQTVPQGDDNALCEAILARCARDQSPDTVAAAQEALSTAEAQHAPLAPLLHWIEEPTRLAAATNAEQAYALQREAARLSSELDAIHRSPTWRTLGAVQRRWRR